MNKFIFIQCHIILFFAVSIFGCKEKEQPKKQEIGEYVYIDQYKCCHVKQNCIELMLGRDDKPNYMVKRVEIKMLNDLSKYRTCSHCVDDETYKKLQEITDDALTIGWDDDTKEENNEQKDIRKNNHVAN